jgi:hypothetical protein
MHGKGVLSDVLIFLFHFSLFVAVMVCEESSSSNNIQISLKPGSLSMSFLIQRKCSLFFSVTHETSSQQTTLMYKSWYGVSFHFYFHYLISFFFFFVSFSFSIYFYFIFFLIFIFLFFFLFSFSFSFSFPFPFSFSFFFFFFVFVFI